MKWLLLFLLLLVGCMRPQYAESNVAPTPLPQETKTEPLEPEIKLPQETEVISVNDAVPPAVSKGEVPCIEDCNNRCEENAKIACMQTERAGCRASCGEIIEPSACVQACTFLSRPDICNQQFEQFCKAKCVGECY